MRFFFSTLALFGSLAASSFDAHAQYIPNSGLGSAAAYHANTFALLQIQQLVTNQIQTLH